MHLILLILICYSVFLCSLFSFFFFFFNDPAPTEIYTLSLHDALPISRCGVRPTVRCAVSSTARAPWVSKHRSEEHTSELQSRFDLVCRLLLEKKKKKKNKNSRKTKHTIKTSDASIS